MATGVIGLGGGAGCFYSTLVYMNFSTVLHVLTFSSRVINLSIFWRRGFSDLGKDISFPFPR